MRDRHGVQRPTTASGRLHRGFADHRLADRSATAFRWSGNVCSGPVVRERMVIRTGLVVLARSVRASLAAPLAGLLACWWPIGTLDRDWRERDWRERRRRPRGDRRPTRNNTREPRGRRLEGSTVGDFGRGLDVPPVSSGDGRQGGGRRPQKTPPSGPRPASVRCGERGRTPCARWSGRGRGW
jgi:hypothetical protein